MGAAIITKDNIMAIKTESVIKKEDVENTELKFDKNKKYMVSANVASDNRSGYYYCNVNFKEYKIPLNKPTELNESTFSHLTNAEIFDVPGSNLKDESTYVDIEKDTFHTERKARFNVTEV